MTIKNREFYKNVEVRKSMGRKILQCVIILFSLALIPMSVYADQMQKTVLSIEILQPGTVRLDGDIYVGDRIGLFSREYRSADHMITDRLLLEMTVETDHSVTVSYGLYDTPLSEVQMSPAFDRPERDITVKALYAVVSDGISEIRSGLFYTDCTLDTGLVNQYWCLLAGSTACGTAAGVIAMQIAYPSSGDALFTRLNEMRKYSLLGEDFSTGPAEYYLCGDHISNAVNKYIAEELSDSLILTDHRTAEKTTEETLIQLLSTGRPAVIEVCYLLGNVTRDFQGISHWITINGFSYGYDGYTFRFADPITVSYRSISSEMLDASNANVSYGDSGYLPKRYIGAFTAPLLSIE